MRMLRGEAEVHTAKIPTKHRETAAHTACASLNTVSEAAPPYKMHNMQQFSKMLRREASILASFHMLRIWMLSGHITWVNGLVTQIL